MNPILILAALAALVVVVRMILKARRNLDPAAAAAEVRAGTSVLVDVREPREWASGVAEPAALLPLSDLKGSRKEWGPFLGQVRGRRIVVYCQSGIRSGMAASILKAEGFQTANLGGYPNWTAKGLPVRRP
jgi:rhodanese-related sulfurtransferase